MSADLIEQLSDALADRIAAAASIVVAIGTGPGHRSGILWRPDVVVASEQVLGDRTNFTVRQAGVEIAATLAGRDPGTNVAVLRLAQPLTGALPADAPAARVGSLALVVGADGQGAATGRLAMVHAVGPAWHSLHGGRIDALLWLDGRLGADEGGPVLTPAGALLGLSTTGPRRRALVIPTATIARVLEPLLADGQIPRGWLGVSLQPVSVPDSLRAVAGHESGMMVVGLATGAPAELAGVLPGDIVLDVDGNTTRRARGLASVLGPDRIGQTVALRILRAGALHTISAVITARPRA